MGTKPKLSELIREGAKLRPQIYGDFFDGTYPSVGDEMVMGSCAFGAAWEAATGRMNGITGDMGDFRAAIEPYCKRTPPMPILMAGVNRNDQQHHTREQIADWLESRGY